YSKLLRGEQFVQAVDLHGATLSWSVKAKKPKTGRLQVEGLNARLLLAQNQLTVVRAEARVLGVNVNASGQLFNPGALGGLAKRDGDTEGSSQLLAHVLSVLEKLKAEERPPRLEIRFKGDAMAPSQMFAEAHFRADRFSIDEVYR